MNRTLTLKAVGWGILSIALYFLLYRYEREILVLSVTPMWSVVLPIGVAFIFSLVHGNFTGFFWDALGVKPKTSGKK